MTPFRAGPAAVVFVLAAGGTLAAETARFDAREDVRAFVAQMTAEHGFDAVELMGLFRQARHEPAVIRSISPPTDPSVRSWRRYRARYLDRTRIDSGLAFWRRHREALRLAEDRYGVPPQIVVAVIGVETVYGRITGRFPTFSALATLAFDYPPRAEAFRLELEQLLLLARDKKRSAAGFRGSYAGALGIPQFLPSSYRRYAIDHDGDGQIELETSASDAIGSVANFLREHGWETGAAVAIPAKIEGDRYFALLEAGIVPSFVRSQLVAHGVSAADGFDDTRKSALIELETPGEESEYWLGFGNFFVLTRYNRSSFYAMAVYHLSRALVEACGEQDCAALRATRP
jgi:membrane-bound lytic murein transglycosylase B